MRICILSVGRTGSSSLYNAIKKHLSNDYYSVSEPFEGSINRPNSFDKDQFGLISKKDNVLIKTIINQTPEGKDEKFINEWIFTFFDRVILLDRLDKTKQVESFSYLTYTKNKRWHRKQFYDMSIVPEKIVKEWDNKIGELKKIFSDLSIKNDKKIYYYEDIFIDKNMNTLNEIFDYIGINMNIGVIKKYILSETSKVRLEEKMNKLI
jgi:hypothetical protein